LESDEFVCPITEYNVAKQDNAKSVNRTAPKILRRVRNRFLLQRKF
jgi:hypothetical protein